MARVPDRRGLRPSSLSACIEKLHKRICGTDLQSQMTGRCSFPYEIGFFLGYPYEGVIGFIDNEGEEFPVQRMLEGIRERARRLNVLLLLQNCTTMYQQLFDEGVSIEYPRRGWTRDFPAAEAFHASWLARESGRHETRDAAPVERGTRRGFVAHLAQESACDIPRHEGDTPL